MAVYNELMKFLREEYFKRNYSEVLTPIMFNKSMWEISGHWEHYQNNMFLTESEGNIFSLKPMNCPGHTVIYSTQTRSYRNLPLRLAEFGQLHRNELSGTLSGLTRVRRFVQDDCHIFCMPDQIQDEMEKELDFAKFVLGDTFNFEYHMELSTKPEKSVGTAEMWEKAEEGLRNALQSKNLKYKLNPGDGAFYGPKIDFHIKDALGRTWQCATIQIDFNLPERFDLNFEGEDGKKHRPVMIHRAMLGSIERFMGVLIEHCAGKFPLWLSPVQVILLPIADRHIDYCEDIASEMKEKGIRADIDGSRETLNKKVRDAQLQQINYILVVGDREQENKSVNVRTRDNQQHGEKKVDAFVEELLKEIISRKF